MFKYKPFGAFLSAISKHPKLSFEIAFFVVIGFVIIISLTLIFRQQGWPQSHEGLSFIMRSKIYADHFLQGDFFPIWASSDAHGMGTPLPIYYHKTFYYVSGALLALAGSAKLAIWLTISAFMYVGAYGMRFCISVFSKDKVLFVVAAALLLFSNYLFSNWLVRGAMAEFTAMMFVPWLLWWCLHVIKNKKLSYSIVPIFFLLFQSHNITALFGMIPVVLACMYFISTKPKNTVVQLLKFSSISALLLFILVLPQLIFQAIFLRDYDPSKITQMGYLASDNYRPISSYLGEGYVWLSNWQELNLGLDKFIWLIIIIGLAVYIFRSIQNIEKNYTLKKLKADSITSFIVACLAIYLALQAPASAFIYETIYPMQFLQFPWRLLSYITPLSILLCVSIIIWMTKERSLMRYAICLLLVAGTLLVSPISYQYNYAFFSKSDISNKLTVKQQGLGSDLLGIGEYLPKIYDSKGKPVSTADTVKKYYEISKTTVKTKSGGCAIKDIKSRARFEDMNKTFSVICPRPSSVYLPISYSSLSKAYTLEDNKKVTLSTYRLKKDPRISVYINSTKPQVIIVDLPMAMRF